jgi:hypothetical protein
VRALGTIIEWNSDHPLSEHELYTGILDYFDNWWEVDTRLTLHHDYLSPPAFALGHDIINMATYVNEILYWLEPKRIRHSESLVIVSSMAEAFFFSARSACDAIAAVLAYKACEKAGQAPSESLSDLIKWVKKHPTRVRPEITTVLSTNFDWFWKLRRMRDQIGHGLADCCAFCDGRQFDIFLLATLSDQAPRAAPLPALSLQAVGDVGTRELPHGSKRRRAKRRLASLLRYPPASRTFSSHVPSGKHQECLGTD